MLTRKILSNYHFKTFGRAFSTQVNEIEYQNAKPFSEIPGLKNPFQVAKAMMPGGRFYQKSLRGMISQMQHEFGSLCIFNAQLGQKPFVMTFLPDDYEKVFRLEGKWPYRRGLDSFEYFRKKVRPDLFPSGAGLTIE